MAEYFAYGSNMSAEIMDVECPGHRVLGRARLPGHRLAFTRRSVRTGTGVADLVADRDAVVWGVLYELSSESLLSLDAKEGRGWAYERCDVRVFTDDGLAHDAVAYVVIEKAAEAIAPSPGYLRRLIEAGHERRLPAEYLDAIGQAGGRVHHRQRPRGPRSA